MPPPYQLSSQTPSESSDSIHAKRLHDLFVDWQIGTSNTLAVVSQSPTASRLELLVEASTRTAPVLGRAARATLQVWLLAALAGTVGNDVESGTYKVTIERRKVADTWGRFLREHRPLRLLAERRDEEHRDRAVRAYRWRQQHRRSTVRASAEVTYLEIWRQRLEKLIACGRGPFRMAVPDIAADEMRDRLLLELVEALADPTRFESLCIPDARGHRSGRTRTAFRKHSDTVPGTRTLFRSHSDSVPGHSDSVPEHSDTGREAFGLTGLPVGREHTLGTGG